MTKKPSRALAIIKPLKPPTNLKTVGARLAKAKTPEAVLAFDAEAAGWEAYMRKAGFSQGDMHLINEHRMRARWRLGQMLAAVARHKGGKGVRAAHGFLETIKRLKLERSRAIEAQRIGYLPRIELERIFVEAREIGELVTITWLIDAARPYWYKASRIKRHKDIAAAAAEQNTDTEQATFPLLYFDPPWRFSVYSEKGLERTPDQKYPTMTDEAIIEYVKPFVPDTGAALMWCTSSNLERALAVLVGCGYDFKSSAAWVKATVPHEGTTLTRFGLGLVFRNMHEILLYGTRGNMPGPQYQPPSVFFYPRGEHSAKPPEIRTEVEKMYPDFDAATRGELFYRKEEKEPDGWSTFGFEAKLRQAAE